MCCRPDRHPLPRRGRRARCARHRGGESRVNRALASVLLATAALAARRGRAHRRHPAGDQSVGCARAGRHHARRRSRRTAVEPAGYRRRRRAAHAGRRARRAIRASAPTASASFINGAAATNGTCGCSTLATGEQRPLTTSPFDEREPDFTPDGRAVVFATNRTGHYCLWSIALDGGVETQLTEESGDGLVSDRFRARARGLCARARRRVVDPGARRRWRDQRRAHELEPLVGADVATRRRRAGLRRAGLRRDEPAADAACSGSRAC